MTSPETKKYSVLLVDDDSFLLEVYASAFKKAGHNVDTAVSCEEALSLLSQNTYDALLLDIVMSPMTGFELLAKIREKELIPNAAVLVLSNEGGKEEIEKAKQYNVDGYIIKASTISQELIQETVSAIEQKNTNTT